jgi:hypothetical protein
MQRRKLGDLIDDPFNDNARRHRKAADSDSEGGDEQARRRGPGSPAAADAGAGPSALAEPTLRKRKDRKAPGAFASDHTRGRELLKPGVRGAEGAGHRRTPSAGEKGGVRCVAERTAGFRRLPRLTDGRCGPSGAGLLRACALSSGACLSARASDVFSVPSVTVACFDPRSDSRASTCLLLMKVRSGRLDGLAGRSTRHPAGLSHSPSTVPDPSLADERADPHRGPVPGHPVALRNRRLRH